MSSFQKFSVRKDKPRRRRKPKIGVHLILCLVIAAGTAAIYVLYQEYLRQRQPVAVAPPDEEPDGPPIAWPQVGGAVPDGEDGGMSGDFPVPVADSPPEEPAEKKIDPAKQKVFVRDVVDVRKAMSEHDLPGARSRLNKAKSDAQTEDELAQAEVLETMLNHLTEFWVGTRKAIAAIKSGDEFVAKGETVVVVEVRDKDVDVKAVGVNRTYLLNDLPHLMLLALAEKWFSDAPSSKVFLGAYLAVDPSGDPARARKLWQAASEQGIDMASLMPELDYWESVPRVAKTVAELRDNPPDEETLKNTRRKVVDRHSDEYQKANSLPRKAALAKKLLESADKTGDPHIFLATIYEARKLAIGAGDISVVYEAIDLLLEYSKLDPLTEKATSLEEAGKYVRGEPGNRDLTNRALKLLEEAVVAERAGDAKMLADLAAKAAKQSKNTTLIKQAAAAGERVSQLNK